MVNNEDGMNIKKFAQSMGSNPLWMKRLSFTAILISSNLLQTLFTKTQMELTSKQWLLLTIASAVPTPPSLSEIGGMMGCSRQNVKQIAQILKNKNFLTFTKNEGDKNTIRLVPTEKWYEYCQSYDVDTSKILEEIFDGFTEEDLQGYFKCFCKVMDNMEHINKKL